MLWPFSKRKVKARLPIKLMFKGGKEFFDYQCEFGCTELKPSQGIVAIVIDAASEFGVPMSIKINDDGSQMAMLKVASDDGGFLVSACTPTGRGDRLKPNDVVVWVPLHYADDLVKQLKGVDPRFGWIGLIVAKIKPEIDTSSPNLSIACRYD